MHDWQQGSLGHRSALESAVGETHDLNARLARWPRPVRFGCMVQSPSFGLFPRSGYRSYGNWGVMWNNRHTKGTKDAFNGWLDSLQASGRYTFTRDELERTGPSVDRKTVWRAGRDGRLIQPRTGFFVIVPVEYRAVGAPPPTWFIDDLMRYQRVPYYVGLLSAASLHGASPQAVQQFQVLVPQQREPVRSGRLRIRFMKRSDHDKAATERYQTPTGSMTISTPEQTALDLARYARASGGWDNVAGVVRDLAPKIDAAKIGKLLKATDDVRPWQRLGYIFEIVAQDEEAARALARALAQHAPRYIALDPAADAKGAERNERWHLLLNRAIEPD